MKKFILCMMLGVMAVGLAGCGQVGSQAEGQGGSGVESESGGQGGSQRSGESVGQEDSQAGQKASYSFTDDLGREVTVESHERVAALLGSYADMWILAGGEV